MDPYCLDFFITIVYLKTRQLPNKGISLYRTWYTDALQDKLQVI